MVRTPCARATRLGCRVVEGTCSKLRQHYMEHHWDRYERTLADPTYLAVLSARTREAARSMRSGRSPPTPGNAQEGTLPTRPSASRT